MQLIPKTSDINRYLVSSEIIDFKNPKIQKTAINLSKDIGDEMGVIKTVYEFVRDDIHHSMDIGSNDVTCKAFENRRFSMFANRRFATAKNEIFRMFAERSSTTVKIENFHMPQNVVLRASDVLKYKHGLCFANSHLLAAILRFLEIPTGFCYQRLEFEGGFGLHGLNAVFIKSLDKWIRLDARGNENGINARFSTNKEFLAYSPKVENGEIDFPIIYSEPDKRVVEILSGSKNLNEALESVFNTNWLQW